MASAGFFVLLASFTGWIKFVSQMEVSYSKLLTGYQSRNGSCFAVNRKHKSNRKEFIDGFDEMRTIRSETNPTCLLDSSDTYTHVLSN